MGFVSSKSSIVHYSTSMGPLILLTEIMKKLPPSQEHSNPTPSTQPQAGKENGIGDSEEVKRKAHSRRVDHTRFVTI